MARGRSLGGDLIRFKQVIFVQIAAGTFLGTANFLQEETEATEKGF